MFAPLRRLSDELTGLGNHDPKVRLSLGQALVDLGALSTAIEVLRKVAKRSDLNTRSGIEVEGIRGRAYKDLFLAVEDGDSGRAHELLSLSVDRYMEGFPASNMTDNWTGESLIALLALTRRRGINLKTQLEDGAIADNLVRAIQELDPKTCTYWHLATLAIVHASRGQWDGAADAIRDALSAKGADAFAWLCCTNWLMAEAPLSPDRLIPRAL